MKFSLLCNAYYIIVFWFSSVALYADSLQLQEGDHFSGELLSIEKDTTFFKSPSSNQILEIRKDAFLNIDLSSSQATFTNHQELLSLNNGDTIPCSILALKDNVIDIDTSFAGKLSIKRDDIKMIHFGLLEDKLIFQDTTELTNWETTSGDWDIIHNAINTTVDNKYKCTGAGSLTRKIETPEHICISFKLEWDTVLNSFSFNFGQNKNSSVTDQTGYQLQINTSRVKIVRYTGATLPKKHLIDGYIHSSDQRDKNINIDIYLDKETGYIRLVINDRIIGENYDLTMSNFGSLFSFHPENNDKVSCYISQLQIKEANSSHYAIKLSQPKGDKSDIFLNHEGEQILGHIKSITNNGNNLTLTFQNTNDEQILTVSKPRIHTLGFGNDHLEKNQKQAPFTATMANQSSLKFHDITVSNNIFTGEHTVLGQCQIPLNAIQSISQQPIVSE